jgi:hypothetical protein
MKLQNQNYSSTGGAKLNLTNPFALLLFIVFYSPVILAVIIFSSSFFYQNFNGFIYLAFLIGVSIVRDFILYITKDPNKQEYIATNEICNMVQFSKYGNIGFSIFVLSFTFMYMCLPMFITGNVNYFIMVALLLYLFMDIGFRFMKSCIGPNQRFAVLFSNMISGAFLGTIIPGALYAGGSSKYLFFSDETPMNGEQCSMPKKQKFKCSVYKNGQLIANTNNL